MPTIKLREPTNHTIKTIDRSMTTSTRMRTHVSELSDGHHKSKESQDTTPDTYASNRAESAMRESTYRARRATMESAPYVKAATSKAIQAYRNRKAEKQLERTRIIPERNTPCRTRINQRLTTQPSTNRGQLNRIRPQKRQDVTNIKQSVKKSKHFVQAISRSVRAIMASTKALIAAIAAGGWIAVAVVLCCVIFGAAFYFFGDESSQNYTPVSAEVEAYTPLIQEYANQYGIGEYTELIKAVMMQESGGRGNDPMQASECGYNKKYPREPNGITNAEYSIDCGIHYLANCLKTANCESPLDMGRIRLALQGYNYGGGYISWAVKRDGGYTIENADVYSDEQAAKHGWTSYGDKQYVAHVLRYYPYGSYNYGVGNTKITQVAAQQIGNKGGKKFWSWYGFENRVEWCACFVSWCADQCGYIKSGTIPKSASVVGYVNWFKSHGQWQKRSYKPSAGDLIIFDWDSDGSVDHIGIVEKCDGVRVYTIEGNSGDACKRRNYALGRAPIYGYCVARY